MRWENGLKKGGNEKAERNRKMRKGGKERETGGDETKEEE